MSKTAAVLTTNIIMLGDNIVSLKLIPDESIDCVITDPPYGLGTREPTLDDILHYLKGEPLDLGGDFMGKPWEIPTIQHWQECHRVLKPGGHLLSFAGTRTLDIMSLGIRVAGFENRDTIADFAGGMFAWIHSQGFPKSMNIFKALKKAGAPPEVCAMWEGWGTAMKPSWEPILVFRKPFKQGTLTAQILATQTGGLNIDATRVKHASAGDFAKHKEMVDRIKAKGGSMANSWKNSSDLSGASDVKVAGRWPPNLVICHHPDCRQVGTQTAKAPIINRFDDGMKPFGEGAGHPYTSTGGGTEEVPVFQCVPSCPVRLLNEQSGVLTSGTGAVKRTTGTGHRPTTFGVENRPEGTPMIEYGDTGGASRFFPSFEGQRSPEVPFFYTGKASTKEKNKGLKRKLPWLQLKENVDETKAEEIQSIVEDTAAELGFGVGDVHEGVDPKFVPANLKSYFEGCDVGGNKHVTVKPLALMEWLVKLVCPKGGVVLDPYCGSGTTCVAAAKNGMKFIGMEKDAASQETAEKRAKVALEEYEAKAFQQGIFEEMFGGDLDE